MKKKFNPHLQIHEDYVSFYYDPRSNLTAYNYLLKLLGLRDIKSDKDVKKYIEKNIK